MPNLYVVPETTVGNESQPDAGIRAEDTDGPPASVFDERFGISLGRRTYYINLRIGAEQRSAPRLEAEGQVPLSAPAIAYSVIGSALLMFLGVLSILYLLKSGMGINLSSEESFLHPLYSLFDG